jgi:hypothetical protein
MFRFASGAAAFAFLFGATLAATVPAKAISSCNSYPCTLSDTYNGGVTTYSNMTGDTIETPGTDHFEIHKAVVNRPTATSVDIKI